MTILTSAYDTTACRNYKREAIQDPLIAVHLMHGTTSHLNGSVYALERMIGGTAKVPSFFYPFIDKIDGVTLSFVDQRSLTSFDEISDKLRIRDQTAYTIKLIVGSIAKDWAEGRAGRYLTSYPLALNVYSSWVSEAIRGRFPIDPGSQLKIAVLAAILYINNFHTLDEVNERSHKAMVQSMITRHCDFRSPEVNSIVNEYYNLNDVESFCIACKDYTQSVRLKDLNVATLFECVGGYWYGNEGRETMAVCLEYPPLWLGVVLSSLVDRSYRSTRLGNITERSHIKREAVKYSQSMLNLGVES